MYFLLILIHLLFITTTHLLGFYILEGIFILSFFFSLLYFSPFFFVKEDNIFSFPEFNFSLKETVNLPVILFYIGIYITIFGFTNDRASFFQAHNTFLIILFFILFGILFAFNEKKNVFFDISRIQLGITYTTIILYSLLLLDSLPRFLTITLIVFTHIFSFFFFRRETIEKPYFFFLWILSILSSLLLGIFFLFPTASISLFPSIVAIFSIAIFEFLPKIQYFREFHKTTRIFLLILILLISVFMAYTALSSISLLTMLFFVILFLFSVHIRYGNSVCLIVGISYIYFIYSVLFFPLLQSGSSISILLFIFFLPLCIIGNTYFWDERSEYDFSILHYSSIGFSIIFSLYSLFFIPLGTFFTPFLSIIVFLFSLLSLLSYFRFTYK